MNTKVKIEMTVEFADGEHGSVKDFVPFKAHESDAAYDIMAAESKKIEPLGTDVISAGFRIQLEPGYEAQIRPRSGNALKKKIQVANAPGTIDSGFRGVVGVIVFNANKDEALIINKGDKIAQMVISKLPEVELEIIDNMSKESDRGEAGFGSTGTAGN